MILSVMASLYFALLLATATLLVGGLLWARRNLQWQSASWICAGLGQYLLTSLVVAWMYREAMDSYQQGTSPFGDLSVGASMALSSYLSSAATAAAVGLFTLLVFGDVIRLAVRAGIQAEGRFVRTVTQLTRKPKMLGITAMVVLLVQLVSPAIMWQCYGQPPVDRIMWDQMP